MHLIRPSHLRAAAVAQGAQGAEVWWPGKYLGLLTGAYRPYPYYGYNPGYGYGYPYNSYNPYYGYGELSHSARVSYQPRQTLLSLAHWSAPDEDHDNIAPPCRPQADGWPGHPGHPGY